MVSGHFYGGGSYEQGATYPSPQLRVDLDSLFRLLSVFALPKEATFWDYSGLVPNFVLYL